MEQIKKMLTHFSSFTHKHKTTPHFLSHDSKGSVLYTFRSVASLIPFFASFCFTDDKGSPPHFFVLAREEVIKGAWAVGLNIESYSVASL